MILWTLVHSHSSQLSASSSSTIFGKFLPSFSFSNHRDFLSLSLCLWNNSFYNNIVVIMRNMRSHHSTYKNHIMRSVLIPQWIHHIISQCKSVNSALYQWSKHSGWLHVQTLYNLMLVNTFWVVNLASSKTGCVRKLENVKRIYQRSINQICMNWCIDFCSTWQHLNKL